MYNKVAWNKIGGAVQPIFDDLRAELGGKLQWCVNDLVSGMADRGVWEKIVTKNAKWEIREKILDSLGASSNDPF